MTSAMILKSRMGNEFADDVYGFLKNHYGDKFELGNVELSFFDNKEPHAKIHENVAGRDVYLIHSFEGYGEPSSPSSNADPSVGTMSLFLINDALKRASVRSNTNVLPYIPWLRADRKDEGRVDIGAKAFFVALESVGGHPLRRAMTFEMHSGQAQGFSEHPIDNLYTNQLFALHCKKYLDLSNAMVVAPDAGGGKRARDLADRLGLKHVYADKKKDGAKKTEVYIIGDVDKRIAIVPDDMIDTGSTLALTADALRKRGVEDVYACATHPILSPRAGLAAEDRLQKAGINLITTDTVPMSKEYREAQKEWLRVITVAPLAARAIYLRETNGSLSQLFEGNFIDELYASII